MVARKRRLWAGWMAAVLLVFVVSGCGNDSGSGRNSGANEQSASANESGQKGNAASSGETAGEEGQGLEPVELTYYYPGTPQKDLGLVEEAMNKILKEKINATVKLYTIDWASFDQKMNVMTSAGDNYDLVFTAPWTNNYFQNVAKGAYVPLDELLDRYAPTLRSTVPQQVWDATKVDGKIYGAINWQIVAMPYGIALDKQWLDKYPLDLNGITRYEDLEPFFEQIVSGNKGVTPLLNTVSSLDGFSSQAPYFGMDTIGDDTSPGWYVLNDPKHTVINQYASPEFKQFTELMYSWYQKGYIGKDAISSSDYIAAAKAGKTVASISFPAKPGAEAELKTRYSRDYAVKPLSKPLITTGRAIATMTAISKKSKNPERAMMFLELMNTDKDLYNLLAHGVEGKHYVKVADNVIGPPEGVKPENNGYSPGTDWMFGNQFNSYYTSEADVGNWEKTIELNKSAEYAGLLGFNFNPEPVKTELAQTGSVIKQYLFSLASGMVDPAKILPEFLDKLNKAGVDKVLAEKQKQLDAWSQSKQPSLT